MTGSPTCIARILSSLTTCPLLNSSTLTTSQQKIFKWNHETQTPLPVMEKYGVCVYVWPVNQCGSVELNEHSITALSFFFRLNPFVILIRRTHYHSNTFLIRTATHFIMYSSRWFQAFTEDKYNIFIYRFQNFVWSIPLMSFKNFSDFSVWDLCKVIALSEQETAKKVDTTY